MDFELYLSRLVIDDISLRAFPAIAMKALEEGMDTPTLRIMAGMEETEYGSVLEKYFNDMLAELGLKLPGEKQAAIHVALSIADEIMEGKKPAYEGVSELINRSLEKGPFREESENFVFDGIDFIEVYCLHDTIYELKVTDHRWSEEKTNEELIIECTEKLLDELKIWAEKMRGAVRE